MSHLLVSGGLLPAEFAEDAVPAPGLPGFARADLLIAERRIQAVLPPGAEMDAPRLDADGAIVLPGFIDVHVHGGAGCDTMDASPESLATMARFFAEHGVTSFAATTMTAGHDETLAAVRAVAAFAEEGSPGARLLGVHLEGPYLSPKFPGAQLAEDIRKPNVAEFVELAEAGPVILITLAPEEAGAEALMAVAIDAGIAVIIGHTNATYDQCIDAIARGASQATHTYNAMTGLHHRRPGTLGAVLSNDDIYGQLIADNVHVHPAAMKIFARCKGVERAILITDAMRAAGLPAGEYDLGGQPVTVQDSQCRLMDGTLAGSVLTMDVALRNFMAACGWSLAEAWPASSRTAATALGLDHELGSIRPGYLADLVVLDGELQVAATIVGGQVIDSRV